MWLRRGAREERLERKDERTSIEKEWEGKDVQMGREGKRGDGKRKDE